MKAEFFLPITVGLTFYFSFALFFKASNAVVNNKSEDVTIILIITSLLIALLVTNIYCL